MADDMELGGKIFLSGFKDIEPAEFVVVKKLVGSYARKFTDNLKGYDSLKLHLKSVHRTPGSEKFEVHGQVIHDGKVHTSELTERNIFIAIDKVLKKLDSLVF